ncbi:uncharacterized protein LOC118200310 [Stegodyphus dumicola]|uniref:uncharacterized protein LOC118200310 n=1 Tax=Stegodyphus dumicola TaxID=202533 RepID=UPI0015B22919|nr:uncharacterized protein LOC118200310 [Stegodyphus dumicola]
MYQFENRDTSIICLQSSSTSSPPYVVNGVFIENESRWKIKSFHCSCKAGAGESCKHCVSVMLFCHENDINELENLSATDMKCSWNTRKYKHLYTPVPVQDFCHVKTPPEHSFCEVKKKKVHEEICKFFKDSAYAKHRARFLEKKELTEMPNLNADNNINVSNVDLVGTLIKVF